jgi:putative flippase GtrA
MKTGFNLKVFLKAQCTSLVASGADYLVYGLLYWGCHVWYLTASMMGLITGGIVSFIVARNWAFDKGSRNIKMQAFLYFLVWNGNLLLNTAGVYLVKEGFHADPTFSKILVSIVVGISYNYLLQKNLVFK